MITIGGNVSIRNGNSLDYCWREAVESLLPICDTVTVCDGCSDDGTWEEIQAWSHKDHRIRTVSYAWPPKSIGTPNFWVDWLNYTREHVKEDYHLQLDGDEVLCPTAVPVLKQYKDTLTPSSRMSLRVDRLNFWLDARHLVPHGKLCGHRVIRFAPRDVWMPSDGAHDKAELAEYIVQNPVHPIRIFHYGFLRKREAFFEKSARCLSYFFNAPEDSRILAVRDKPGNWMEQIQGVEWSNQLLPYDGTHPPQMIPWLKERGFKI